MASVAFVLHFDVAKYVAEFHLGFEAAGPAVLDDTATEQAFAADDLGFAGAAGGDAERDFIKAAVGRILSHDDELDLTGTVHLAGIVIGVVLDPRRGADTQFTRGRSDQWLALWRWERHRSWYWHWLGLSTQLTAGWLARLSRLQEWPLHIGSRWRRDWGGRRLQLWCDDRAGGLRGRLRWCERILHGGRGACWWRQHGTFAGGGYGLLHQDRGLFVFGDGGADPNGKGTAGG